MNLSAIWYLEYLVNFFILAIGCVFFFFGNMTSESRFILAKDFFLYIYLETTR